MKVTSGQAAMRTTRQFTITEDHPVHPMAYSRSGKKVRVDSGVIEYQWTPEGWTVRNEYRIDLHCTVLKQDGSPGVNIHTRNPNSKPDRWRSPSLELTDDYAWLQAVIDLLRPSGDLAMTTLNEAEVTNGEAA